MFNKSDNEDRAAARFDAYRTRDPRVEKRIERKMLGSDVQYAYYLGEEHFFRHLHRNPFPPGRRHDAYEHGRAFDAMGEHNGRNR